MGLRWLGGHRGCCGHEENDMDLLVWIPVVLFGVPIGLMIAAGPLWVYLTQKYLWQILREIREWRKEWRCE